LEEGLKRSRNKISIEDFKNNIANKIKYDNIKKRIKINNYDNFINTLENKKEFINNNFKNIISKIDIEDVEINENFKVFTNFMEELRHYYIFNFIPKNTESGINIDV
jgi:hypothetical protein